MASRKTTTDQLDLFAVAPVQTAPTKLVETPQPILDTRDLVLSQEQVEPNVSTASDDVVPQEQLVEVPSADDVVVARDPTTLPTGDDERSVWLCFFSGPDGIPPREPGLVRAGSRQGAEMDAAVSCKLPLRDILAIRASERMVVDNPWLPAPPPTAHWSDRLMLTLDAMIRDSDAENRALEALNAEALGCSVDELGERLAANDAANRKAKADAKANKTANVPKAPPRIESSGPRDKGMRRITDRQRDLLGLVRVEGQRAFVNADGHVPDWADLKDVLQLLGAKWKTSTKNVPGHFVFPDDVDAADVVGVAFDAGEVFDARLHGAYFTPVPLADKLVSMAPLVSLPDRRLRVLEPSAGIGRLADAVKRAYPDADIDCIELLEEHRRELVAAGHSVIDGIGGDFMLVHPSCEGLEPYDAAIMNPPFQRGTDRVHVLHAAKLVRVGGVVLAIVSGSIESRTDVRSVQLRRIIETHGGRIEIIPNGGFAESGTMIKTAMLMFNVCAHCRTTCSVLK